MTHRALLVTLVVVMVACKGASTGSPDASAPPPKIDPAPPPPAASATSTGAESRSANAPGAPVARTFAFDTDATEKPPAQFAFGRTGSGAQGRWIVRREPGSPSGANVLAQLDADDTNFRFPIAVATEPKLANVRVSVRCKMISGRVDQACGLVARYADENNYLITRANALEGNIRLYTVKNGRRNELASFSGTVSAAVWHEYRFELRGDRLQVFWDAKQVRDHRDSTFTAAGSAGVWTKADSVTYFDDLTIEPL